MAELLWKVEGEEISFSCIESGTPVSHSLWASKPIKTRTGSLANVAALLDFVNSGLALPSSTNERVAIDHATLATLKGTETQELGLPPPAPVRLNIKSKGALSSPAFSLTYRLIDSNGRPFLGFKREGAFGFKGKSEFTILEPLYSLLNALDDFKDTPSLDPQERFAKWGAIAGLLPEQIVLDDQLQSINVVGAEHFSLQVGENSNFDPFLVNFKTDDLDEQTEETEHRLPELYEKRFQNQFRKFSEAKPSYAVGDSWYVIVPDRARNALQKVRAAQDLPLEQRRSFLSNPAGAVAEENEEGEVTSLFVETPEFLSGRVKEIGVWDNKLAAFVYSSGTEWLPSEELILSLDLPGSVVQFAAEHAPEILDLLLEASGLGESTIEFMGQVIEVSEATILTFQRIVDRLEALKEPPESARQPSYRVPVLLDNVEALEYVADTRVAAQLEPGYPEMLATRPLYSFQDEGLQWLQSCWLAGKSGGILADDMGLGKTLQTLAFMGWLAEAMRGGKIDTKPILIVAPTGLLRNWEEEALKHLSLPGLGEPVRLFGGDKKALKGLSDSERSRRLTEASWALTSYETLRDQIFWFVNVDWCLVAFDEAQKIKNPASRMTEMAKSLESDFTLMLTGTPVENALADLWCITDGALPGLLGSQSEFDQQYERPSREDPVHAASLKTLLQEDEIPPAMLRRMKEDHLHGLPNREEHVLELQMSMDQQMAYNAVAGLAANPDIQISILEIIQRLRSVSLAGNELSEGGIDEKYLKGSARLKGTFEILDKINAADEKVLVFVESLELQKQLVPYLQQKYQLDHPPPRISGEIDGIRRKRLVDEFQARPKNDFDVMILSPKAGGVGLTITAANHVIHLSRWWNPAVEDQCTDRVYRIGQERPVSVWFPLAIHPKLGNGSFDVKLHELLERKRALSRTALLAKVDKQDQIDLVSGSIN